MKKKRFLIPVAAAILLLAGLAFTALAASVYSPSADSFTYRGDPDTVYGLEENMMLEASNLQGCVMSSYLWFKFDVPVISGTSNEIKLQLQWVDIDLGLYELPAELLSSTNITWSEAALTWTDQPALNPAVLARSPNVPNGGLVTFQSPELTQYVLDNAGKTITLVVRPDCTTPGAVGLNPVRLLRAREYGASGAALIVAAPTSLRVISLSAQAFETNWVIFLALLLALGLLARVRSRLFAR